MLWEELMFMLKKIFMMNSIRMAPAALLCMYAVKTVSYHFSGRKPLNIAGADIQLLSLIAQNASREVLKAIQERLINFDFERNTNGLRAIDEGIL